MSKEQNMSRRVPVGAEPARTATVHPTIVDPTTGKRRPVTQDDVDGMVHHINILQRFYDVTTVALGAARTGLGLNG